MLVLHLLCPNVPCAFKCLHGHRHQGALLGVHSAEGQFKAAPSAQRLSQAWDAQCSGCHEGPGHARLQRALVEDPLEWLVDGCPSSSTAAVDQLYQNEAIHSAQQSSAG